VTDDMDEPGWHRAPEGPEHLNPRPRLGESRYRSIDHQILAVREQRDAAEAEVARLTRHLEYIEAMGQGGGMVAGTPLAIYARAAILNRLP
jgi:hypothetical protein